VIAVVAARWYLRYGLSYRDDEELVAERGIGVDHVTVYRWVQTFASEFIDAERWTYLYRAVDQHGQVIDVFLSERRDGKAARALFTPRTAMRARARRGHHRPRAGLPARDRRTRPQQRGTCSSSTPTTSSTLITAASKPGPDQCAEPNECAQRPRSRPGTRSCTTFAAATTNSPSTYRLTIASAWRSLNSRPPSDGRRPTGR
jgi:hypothetical protein